MQFLRKKIHDMNQDGISPVDAIFAMIIASMVAVAVTMSLNAWFTVRTQTASQDGANQYAQGIIAKASAVEWDKLGFVAPTVPPSQPYLTSDTSCPTAFRPTAKVGDATLNTVTLTSGTNPSGMAQTSVTQVRGQQYCVITDVTWGNPADSSTAPANGYGVKNISVKVSWVDKGTARSISVNSIRTPNIGEAVPAGISLGHNAEVSPIKSFNITKAYNDGTNEQVCYTADWNDTTDTITAVGSTATGLSPVAVSKVLSATDRTNEQCFANNNPSYSYYGLTVSDSAGVKFVGTANYQYPGSQLTVNGNTLTWNAYPATGTTTYKIYESTTQTFTDPPIATTTDTTYTLNTTSNIYVMVETDNSNYSVNAKSNIVAMTPPATPSPTPTPTQTAWTTSSQPYTPPPTSSPCFTDVASDQYYKEICWAKDRGISTGYSDGTYRPSTTVTRDQMAAFFYRLDRSPAYTAPATSHFSDVPVGAAFYKEINWMYDAGITTGYPDGTYQPSTIVTRDQMAAFFYRLAGSPAYTAPTTSHFSDVTSSTAFYKEINWMYDAGIFTGYPDGTYHPSTSLPRDEMASLMFNWNYRFGTL